MPTTPPHTKLQLKTLLYHHGTSSNEKGSTKHTSLLPLQKHNHKPLTKGPTPYPNQGRGKAPRHQTNHPTKRSQRRLRGTTQTNIKRQLYFNPTMPQRPRQPTNTNPLWKWKQLYAKQISHLRPPTLSRQRPTIEPHQTPQNAKRNIKRQRRPLKRRLYHHHPMLSKGSRTKGSHRMYRTKQCNTKHLTKRSTYHLWEEYTSQHPSQGTKDTKDKLSRPRQPRITSHLQNHHRMPHHPQRPQHPRQMRQQEQRPTKRINIPPTMHVTRPQTRRHPNSTKTRDSTKQTKRRLKGSQLITTPLQTNHKVRGKTQRSNHSNPMPSKKQRLTKRLTIPSRTSTTKKRGTLHQTPHNPRETIRKQGEPAPRHPNTTHIRHTKTRLTKRLPRHRTLHQRRKRPPHTYQVHKQRQLPSKHLSLRPPNYPRNPTQLIPNSAKTCHSTKYRQSTIKHPKNRINQNIPPYQEMLHHPQQSTNTNRLWSQEQLLPQQLNPPSTQGLHLYQRGTSNKTRHGTQDTKRNLSHTTKKLECYVLKQDIVCFASSR